MALLQTTLATALEELVPTSGEGVAEQRLAAAYGAYMKQAVAGAVPIVAAAVDATAIPAMASAMAFALGSAADGAAVVVAGVTAFWAAMVAAPAAFFAGAIVITAPPFGGLAAALAATFSANTSGAVSLVDAVNAMATDMHSATAGIGTATFPGPVVSAIV